MLPLSTLEDLLIQHDAEYFGKIESAKRRDAIVHALSLLPLPCRGEREDAELCNLRDDLESVSRKEELRYYKSLEELVAVFAKRVKETLESDLLP